MDKKKRKTKKNKELFLLLHISITASRTLADRILGKTKAIESRENESTTFLDPMI